MGNGCGLGTCIMWWIVMMWIVSTAALELQDLHSLSDTTARNQDGLSLSLAVYTAGDGNAGSDTSPKLKVCGVGLDEVSQVCGGWKVLSSVSLVPNATTQV